MSKSPSVSPLAGESSAEVCPPTSAGMIAYLKTLANPNNAVQLQRYFKTRPGEYGAGDIFLGIRQPTLRQTIKRFKAVETKEITPLLTYPLHEIRMFGWLLLGHRYQKATADAQTEIFETLLAHKAGINNWDLVDVNIPNLVGHYLFHHPEQRSKLKVWVQSENLWDRRIAIIATAYFIKQGQLDCTLYLAEKLLQDSEDLIHKAVGWMLREAAKQDFDQVLAFIQCHYDQMPRTMLRYAIERFDAALRQAILKGRFSVAGPV